jgi:hypothetical protein
MGNQLVTRPLPTQNKRTQTSMPRMEFKLTTPVFGQAKMVHALGCAATVIGNYFRIREIFDVLYMTFHPLTIVLSV